MSENGLRKIPQGPADEPATMLLERIRAERAASRDGRKPRNPRGRHRSETSNQIAMGPAEEQERRRRNWPCSICGSDLLESYPQDVILDYPNLVCRQCDKRAVNRKREEPNTDGLFDGEGDNPVVIDGIKCWRRYRFGGWVTMRDKFDCETLDEFYKRHFPGL